MRADEYHAFIETNTLVLYKEGNIIYSHKGMIEGATLEEIFNKQL